MPSLSSHRSATTLAIRWRPRALVALFISATTIAACGGSTGIGESLGGARSENGCAEGDEKPGDPCGLCTCSEGEWSCSDDCEPVGRGGASGSGARPSVSGGSAGTGGFRATGGRPGGGSGGTFAGGTGPGGAPSAGGTPGLCTPGVKRKTQCGVCWCDDTSNWQCEVSTGECNECIDGTSRSDGCNECSCTNGSWICTDRACPAECPPPTMTDADVGCPAVVVYARDPEAGTCCEYGDPCRAPAGWEQFYTAEECAKGALQCVDGEMRLADDGCNTCTCSGGLWACTEIACPETKACGGWLGNTCADDEYCAYREGQHCGAADASAWCLPRPQGCTMEFSPICGCDGNTYATTCAAALKGTGVLHSGECGTR